MLGLKENCGRLEIKAMGITITQKSTQKQLANALKHRPELKSYILELTDAQIKAREKKASEKVTKKAEKVTKKAEK